MIGTKPARHRKPYTDAELRVILSCPPTWSRVAQMAAAFERTEEAIKLVYTIAHLPLKDLSPKMKNGATWRQIRRVAGQLGYIQVGKRERGRLGAAATSAGPTPCRSCTATPTRSWFGRRRLARSSWAAASQRSSSGAVPRATGAGDDTHSTGLRAARGTAAVAPRTLPAGLGTPRGGELMAHRSAHFLCPRGEADMRTRQAGGRRSRQSPAGPHLAPLARP